MKTVHEGLILHRGNESFHRACTNYKSRVNRLTEN